jgi:folate-dependent phosphoribosylglycinamide formyltransferase PurN
VPIVLCTSGGLYGALVMRRLAADPRVRLVGVVLSSRVLRKDYGWLRGVWAQYRLSGLRYLLYLWAATGLAELLGRGSSLPPVQAQAASLGCPLHVTRDLNDAAGSAFVDRCAPDLLVSAFFNQRIAAHICARPPAGAVNIHPSLLPALKGVDPVFFARLRGIHPLGVTLHRVAAQLDAGAVLARAELPVSPDDSVLAATARLFECGAGLLLAQLEQVLAGDPGTPQAGAGSYDSWPTPAQVRALLDAGVDLVHAADLRAMRAGDFGQS